MSDMPRSFQRFFGYIFPPRIGDSKVSHAEFVLASAVLVFLAASVSSADAQWNSNYTIRRIGLFGAEQTGGSGLQYSTANFFALPGFVAGSSNRYFIGIPISGANTWAYNPGTNTTVQTGLTGSAHTGSAGYQFSVNNFQNDRGQVAGYSNRVIGVDGSSGANTWAYHPGTGTTVQTGLNGLAHTGSSGYQSGVNNFQNVAGQIAGASQRIAGVNGSNGENTWVYKPSTNTTVQTGLTGSAHTGSAGYQFSVNGFQNDAGHVAGYTYRVVGVNGSNGQNSWAYNPMTNTTVQTGLTGAAYTGSTGYQIDIHRFQNNAGQVAGISQRVIGVNGFNGHDSWVYDPGTNTTAKTGLAGPAYTGSAGYQWSGINFQNNAGQVAGVSARIGGVDVSYGFNTWVYDPVTRTTVQTGLTGAVHTNTNGYQNSVNAFQNDAGHVAGYSDVYTGGLFTGRNTWAFNPGTSTTVRTGLSGPAHTGSAGYQHGTIVFQNAAGQVAGVSRRITGADVSNGQNSWAYNPGTNTTVQTGLTGAANTGSAGYQFSESTLQTATGVIAGYSTRIAGVVTNNGSNSWLYHPGTNTTVQIGMIGPAHTGSGGYQTSGSNFLNAAGQVAGTSARVTGVQQLNGYNTWAYNPQTNTTVQTGLTGVGYTGFMGYQFSGNRFQNEVGQVAGISLRIVGVSDIYGQDAWYFDPFTGVTTGIFGSILSGVNFTSTEPTLLTDGGFVLGNYTFVQSGNSVTRVFLFRPDLGLTDLGALVSGGLTANGWRTLQNPIFADALTTLVGYGFVNGQTIGQSVFVLNVPGPSAVGVLGLGVVVGLRRRRGVGR